MRVFVISLQGHPLMPCKPRKARLLVKEGKAKVISYRPYTIKLLYKTGGAVQDITVGIDTGTQHIGTAVIAGDKVVFRSETVLRSTMEKRKLMEARKTFRRSRRYRNTRYRHPKFKYHTKRVYQKEVIKRNGHMTHWVKVKNDFTSNRKEGWLPPSVQSKVDHHTRWIKKIRSLLPSPRLVIEVGRFDMQHMKEPDVHNELYQRGPQYGYENVKAYVFDRDRYQCQCCKRKGGTVKPDGTVVKLVMHHIDFRSKASSDNPEGLITVCTDCHTANAHKQGGILYQWMLEHKTVKRGLRDATMMNIMAERLKEAFPNAVWTYGNFTAANRKRLLLKKSHANDAVAIAVYERDVNDNTETTMIYKQIRRKKRSLHEATLRKGRKEPNRTAKRNSKNTKECCGIYLYDKVKIDKTGQIGWVTGFTGRSAYVKDKNGSYITVPGKGHKQQNISGLTVLRRCTSNWGFYSDSTATA